MSLRGGKEDKTGGARAPERRKPQQKALYRTPLEEWKNSGRIALEIFCRSVANCGEIVYIFTIPLAYRTALHDGGSNMGRKQFKRPKLQWERKVIS